MSIEIGRLEVQSGEIDRQARVVRREESAMCDMRYVMRKCKCACSCQQAGEDNFAGSVCAGICGYCWLGRRRERRREEMEGARWWAEV